MWPEHGWKLELSKACGSQQRRIVAERRSAVTFVRRNRSNRGLISTMAEEASIRLLRVAVITPPDPTPRPFGLRKPVASVSIFCPSGEMRCTPWDRRSRSFPPCRVPGRSYSRDRSRRSGGVARNSRSDRLRRPRSRVQDGDLIAAENVDTIIDHAQAKRLIKSGGKPASTSPAQLVVEATHAPHVTVNVQTAAEPSLKNHAGAKEERLPRVRVGHRDRITSKPSAGNNLPGVGDGRSQRAPPAGRARQHPPTHGSSGELLKPFSFSRGPDQMSNLANCDCVLGGTSLRRYHPRTKHLCRCADAAMAINRPLCSKLTNFRRLLPLLQRQHCSKRKAVVAIRCSPFNLERAAEDVHPPCPVDHGVSRTSVRPRAFQERALACTRKAS